MSRAAEPKYPVSNPLPCHTIHSRRLTLTTRASLTGVLEVDSYIYQHSTLLPLVYGVAAYHDDWVLSREWLMAKCPCIADARYNHNGSMRDGSNSQRRARVSVAKGEFGQIGVILSPTDTEARLTSEFVRSRGLYMNGQRDVYADTCD